jgi:hypothetical protein
MITSMGSRWTKRLMAEKGMNREDAINEVERC